jgi:hypothetical protein
VQSANYFRDQAVLCLEMARQMSDPQAAENLRAAAAQRFARATELERTDAARWPRDDIGSPTQSRQRS